MRVTRKVICHTPPARGDVKVVCGRATPGGDGYFRENRFWRGKWETDQINTFGVGERPDYGKYYSKGGAPVGPDNYGDVRLPSA